MNTLSSLLQWIGSTIGANPNTLKTTNKTLVGAINEMTTMLYPVGCYFWTSDSSFNPATTFGGSWEKLNEGIALVSAGSTYTIKAGVAKDGGNKDAIVPSHNHSVNSFAIPIKTLKNSSGSSTKDLYYSSGETTKYIYAPAHNTNATGVSGVNANMPPYKAAYCWHRVA